MLIRSRSSGERGAAERREDNMGKAELAGSQAWPQESKVGTVPVLGELQSRV